MKELRTRLSFTQLRFYCSKNKKHTPHLTTAADSNGADPKACGSFMRMKDDNSKIAADCNQWYDKK